MKKVKVNVEGMSCMHCVKSVEGAVGALKGVKKVEVDLDANSAEVEYDENKVGLEDITKEIEEQGYTVV